MCVCMCVCACIYRYLGICEHIPSFRYVCALKSGSKQKSNLISRSPLPIALVAKVEWLILERKHQQQHPQQQQQQLLLRIENYRKRKILENEG